jgi:hypothetical protein
MRNPAALALWCVVVFGVIDAAGQRTLAAVVAELRKNMTAGYGAKAITLQGTRIRTVLDAPKISESAYLTALDFTCIWLGADAMVPKRDMRQPGQCYAGRPNQVSRGAHVLQQVLVTK